MASTRRTTIEPVSAHNIAAQYENRKLVEGSETIPWVEAREQLGAAQWFWLATVAPDGASPQIRPVLAVWVDEALYFTAGPKTAKARNLRQNRRAALSARSEGLDLVVEGETSRVDDVAALETVAEEFQAKYGWPAEVAEDAVDAPYGAPTAGPPPYHVYRMSPAVVYGVGIEGTNGTHSTRWRF